MSNFISPTKLLSQTPTNDIYKNKKRSTSQIKYQKAPDIMTQAKPSYLNNFVQPINPHQSAFTPTNHSKNPENKNLLLPKKTNEFSNKKTLILDLDETLVHSSFIPFEKNDIVLNIEFESVMYNIYVLVRPNAEEFIKKVSKIFEVIIFTASIEKYALPLLDILDKDKNIKYRLTREHCTFLNGIYIKELKKLNRNLKDLIIVDNSPLAYAFDNDNGLPIKAWYDDKSDDELNKIYPLLEYLSRAKDVRNFVKLFVKNNEIDYDLAMSLIKSREGDKNNEETNTKNNITSSNHISSEPKTEKEKKSISVNKNVNLNNKKNKGIEKNGIKDKNENNKNKAANDKQDMKENINNKINNNMVINTNNNKMFKSKNNIKNNIHNDKITNIKTNVIAQKKKNMFRAGPKYIDKFPLKGPNSIYFINNIKYPLNNIDNEYLLSLSLSNTTKNIMMQKTQIKFNNNKNNVVNNTNKNKDHLFFQKNLLNDKKNLNSLNKKYNYTNFLEKIENRTIKPVSLSNKNAYINQSTKGFTNKNILQKKKFSIQNINQNINHKRVSSSLIGKYHSLLINNSNVDQQANAHHASRSKSTINFLSFSKIVQKPKTPKGQFSFGPKIDIGLINKSNKKVLNIVEGFSNTTRHKNNFKFLNNDEMKKNNAYKN